MIDRSTSYAGQVRALFEAAPQARLQLCEMYERANASTVRHRERISSAARDLVLAGYLVKEGRGKKAEFSATGKGMPRKFVVTDEQREQCRADKAMKQSAYRASKRAGTSPRAPDKMTINRARVDLRADLAPAKPWGKEKSGQRPTETVEQFQARGGQVQRLTASWEQAA